MGHTIYQLECRKYTLDFKHQVCKEHIVQGLALSELVRKYELSSHPLIHDWLRRLGYVAPTYRQFSRRLYISEVKDTVIAKQTPVKPQEKTSEVDCLILKWVYIQYVNTPWGSLSTYGRPEMSSQLFD